jgi:hypothetical protein
LVVVGLVCFGFALSELTGDKTPVVAEDEPVLRAAAPAPARDTAPARGERSAEDRGAVASYTASGGGPAAGSEAAGAGAAGARPQRASAYTVVLVTSSDRAGARRVARDAARSGLEAGLLRSDDYDLGEGLWLVAVGRHDRAQATRRATRLAERYPGAYAQLLKAGG